MIRVVLHVPIWNSDRRTKTFAAMSFIISLDLANTRNWNCTSYLTFWSSLLLIMWRTARPRFYFSPRLFSNILWMFQYFKKVPSLRETIASIILYYGSPATTSCEGSASIEFLQLFHFRLTVRLYFANFLLACFSFFM